MEIVFDFDGTIADTLGHAVSILNRLASEYGFEPITEADVDRFRRVGSKKALKEFKVGWIQFLRVAKRVKKELNKEIKTVKLFPGIIDVLKELKKEGHTLGLLSSGTKKNVGDLLRQYKLEDIFSYRQYCGWMWGKSRGLRKIMRKRGIEDWGMVYVGDETKDIIACKKARVKSLAVTWGYNSEKALRNYSPEWLVKKPEEIIEVVGQQLK